MTLLHKNDEFVTCCNDEIKRFLDGQKDIDYAFVATSDGFTVASVFPPDSKKKNTDDKLAAVSSSMMALGSSLASEFDLTDCKTITVDSTSGKILLRPIVTAEQSFILLVEAKPTSLLGYILHGMDKVEENLVDKARKLNETDSPWLD